MEQTLINLVLALSVNELFHNIAEVTSAREKVKRLATYISGKEYKEMKFNIDTRLKAYTITTLSFIVFVGTLFAIFSLIDLSLRTGLQTAAVILIITYFYTAISLDKYHVEIEKVTKKFKK